MVFKLSTEALQILLDGGVNNNESPFISDKESTRAMFDRLTFTVSNAKCYFSVYWGTVCLGVIELAYREEDIITFVGFKGEMPIKLSKI